MEYRKLNKADLTTSVFGIGCMRLPLLPQPAGSTGKSVIDEAAAIEMIRHGIDSGVNYIDTAWPYHGGQSELVVAKALRDGYRSKVSLATKLPTWLTNKREDFDQFLNDQLAKLETDHIDFYLLHALGRESWDKVVALGVLQFLDDAKKSGKIRQAAFSFHDELPLFKEIIDSYDWDMCQIQLNLLDEKYQAGTEGLRYAAAKGIDVVVMEPLRGGSLAETPPPDIQATWAKAAARRTPVEWAFRWLADQPEIKVILSGVSSMEQLNDNLRIFAATSPGMLSQADRDLCREIQALYHQKIKVGCTGCNYCMPCPHGVAIPDVFRIYNQSSLFFNPQKYGREYAGLGRQAKDASQCVSCGLCEPACPQGIPIIAKLAEAAQSLQI